MIIQCINCDKKFEVNNSLIPNNGRNIQCGSCNHTWFYNPTKDTETIILPNDNNKNSESINEIEEDTIDEILIKKKNLSKNEDPKELVKFKKSNDFGLGKILSYIVVSIISFVALIIFLDTFKSPLTNIFPDLELLLYNLFETLKDIFLFVKNLF